MTKHKNRKQEHGGALPVPAPRRMSRRTWVSLAVGSAAAALVAERWWRSVNPAVITADSIPITVYASPSCGCCQAWISHLEQSGFYVTVEKVLDVTPIKRQFGVPDSLWSCHTAMMHAYAIEGHVPADLIQRVARERPAIAGLAVPGMPKGSPGMEGLGADTYDVLAYRQDGTTTVYATRRGLSPVD